MGLHQPQEARFSDRIHLEPRLRPDPPLRRVAQVLDCTFVRAEVAQFYGPNGHEGVDPILRARASGSCFSSTTCPVPPARDERLGCLPERLDYLWFLGCSLEEITPHHRVLSKARRRGIWATGPRDAPPSHPGATACLSAGGDFIPLGACSAHSFSLLWRCCCRGRSGPAVFAPWKSSDIAALRLMRQKTRSPP